jgi:hypothetical protein
MCSQISPVAAGSFNEMNDSLRGLNREDPSLGRDLLPAQGGAFASKMGTEGKELWL